MTAGDKSIWLFAAPETIENSIPKAIFEISGRRWTVRDFQLPPAGPEPPAWPDLALVDLVAGGEPVGFELVSRLREAGFAGSLIALVSVAESPLYRYDCQKYGRYFPVDDFIEKPPVGSIDFELLRRKIEKQLNRRG